MGIVIDASIAAVWLLDDEVNGIANRVLEEMHNGTPIVVPALWLLEITNVLFKNERQRRIDRQQRHAAQARIESFPITIATSPTKANLQAILIYAERHQLSTYDAEYLRVAKDRNLSLATLDKNLLAAAKREN